jgi:ankyrin repeat protein
MHLICKNILVTKEMIDLMLEHKADVDLKDLKDQTPLRFYLHNKTYNWDILKPMLLSEKTSQNDRIDQQFLTDMLDYNHFTFQAILFFEKHFSLSHDTIVNKSNEPFFFHLMAQKVSFESLSHLIAKKADLNFINSFSETPLHKYCFNKEFDPKIFKFLLDNKASTLHQKDFSDNYPFNYLKKEMKRDTLIVLLSQPNYNFSIISTFEMMDDLIHSYNNDSFWNPSLHHLFPLESQNQAFYFILSLRSFSKKISILFPKPLIKLILSYTFSRDHSNPLFEL